MNGKGVLYYIICVWINLCKFILLKRERKTERKKKQKTFWKRKIERKKAEDKKEGISL
jgi:hypothetical protein